MEYPQPITDDSHDESDTSITSPHELPVDEESPLQLAIDDLESRIVSSFNEFKSYVGGSSNINNSGKNKSSIHDELSQLLRPILELSSHLSPSSARAVHSSFPEVYDLETITDTIYTKINSELILPVLLESAQSEIVPAKRAASLKMFHLLFVEWGRSGSWLDSSGGGAGGTGSGMSATLGPYGPGESTTTVVGGADHHHRLTESERQRRITKRSLRRSELLRRWVQACLPNLSTVFTNEASDVGAAGRGVLSASAALKPCLRYIAERIGEADDAGALRLFLPVMRMIERVLGRVFLEASNGSESGGDGNEALKSSCIKFLEIVVLCFSQKALPGMGSGIASRMKKEAGVS